MIERVRFIRWCLSCGAIFLAGRWREPLAYASAREIFCRVLTETTPPEDRETERLARLWFEEL